MSTSTTKPLRKTRARNQGPSQRVYGGVEHEERVRARRERLLAAGVQIFGTLGYRGATVRAICEETKLTDRYYYEAFSGPEEYLLAVYKMLIAEIETDVVSAVTHAAKRGGGVSECATAGLKAFFARMRDTRVSRIVMFEVVRVSREVDAEYKQLNQRLSALLMQSLKQVVPQLELSKDAELVVGNGLFGSVWMITVQWLLNGQKPALKTVIAACTALIEGSVQHLVGTPGTLQTP
jgi:AcrR family transcriptional regulator